MLEFRENQIWNALYQDTYAPYQGALEQAEKVFILGNDLRKRFSKCQNMFVIGELGFGTGANFCHTAHVFIEEAKEKARLFYVACEKNPLSKEELEECHRFYGINSQISKELIQNWPKVPFGFEYLTFRKGKIALLLLMGDVQVVWDEFSGIVDAWYLDGFSPKKNSEMWDKKVFLKLKQISHRETTFATYSVARQVKEALREVGASFEKKAGFWGKREILVGRFHGEVQKEVSCPTQATIVGGGIAGSALAYSLSSRGIYVRLFEKGFPLKGASSVKKALIMPTFGHIQDPMVNLSRRGYLYTKNFLKTHGSYIPAEIHYIPVRRLEKEFPALFFPYELSKSLANYPVFIFQGGIVEGPSLCSTLIKEAQVDFFNQEFLPRDLDLKDEEIMVWCTGKELKNLNLPIDIYWGEVFSFNNSYFKKGPVYVAKSYYFSSGESWYLGSTYSLEVPQKDPVKAQTMLEELSLYFGMPFFSGEKLKTTWVNARTVSRDRLPIVGPHPAWKNQYLLGALGSKGFSLALYLAEVLAALICKEPLPIEKSLLKRILSSRFFK